MLVTKEMGCDCTYLNTAQTSRECVGDAVSDEFSVHIEIVFSDSSAESRNVDWHMDDAKEG